MSNIFVIYFIFDQLFRTTPFLLFWKKEEVENWAKTNRS